MVNPSLRTYIIAYSNDSKVRIQDKLVGLEDRITFLPSFFEGTNACEQKGDFSYLNWLIGGK